MSSKIKNSVLTLRCAKPNICVSFSFISVHKCEDSKKNNVCQIVFVFTALLADDVFSYKKYIPTLIQSYLLIWLFMIPSWVFVCKCLFTIASFVMTVLVDDFCQIN